MGQILLPDNIPSLSITGSATLSLPATNLGQTTRITVGGQQYKLDSAITCNLATNGLGGLDTGSQISNARYYVYAVVSGSTLGLVASLSSPNPSGFTTSTFLMYATTNSDGDLVSIGEDFPNGGQFDNYVNAGAGFGIGSDSVLNANGLDVTGKSFFDVDGVSKTITGFTGGVYGQTITIVNQSGGGYYRFQHNTGSFDKVILPASDVFLAPNESISFVKRGALWYLTHKTTKDEYITADCGATSQTSAADTYVDVAGMGITLNPGVWDIGYDVCVRVNANLNQAYGNIVITDTSNVQVSGTYGGVAIINSGNQDFVSVSRNTRITVTSSLSGYKTRVRCQLASASAYLQVFPNNLTASLTNPDNNSTMWARRVL